MSEANEYDDNVNDNGIGFIFNAKKTKYTDLNEMLGIEGNSRGILDKDINFFIDTNFIFDFFRIKYYEELTSKIIDEELSFQMAAEFLNLIGHYKNYFGKLTTSTIRFYIINAPLHGDSSKEQDTITRSKYTHPKALKFLDFIINKRLRPVVELMSDTYIISTKKAHKTVIPYVLMKNYLTKHLFNKKSINIFMAKSVTFGQYAFLAPNSFFFNKAKFNNKDSIFDTVTSKYKDVGAIDRYGILLYQVFTGEDSPFGFLDEKIKNRKVISVLEGTEKLSVNTYNSPSIFINRYIETCQTMKKHTPMNTEELTKQIEERIAFFDIIERYNSLSESTILEIVNEIIDYETDKKALFELNTKYFDDNINVSNLL